jgi:CubicO group peptidase (beta-lactamase class C family)
VIPGCDAARRVLEEAIRTRIFPGAAVDVGSSDGSAWQDALGTLAFDGDGVEASRTAIDTPFDLASLTKPIATAAVFMQLVNSGAMTVDDPVTSSLPEWTGADRSAATVADLLEHASGLPARLLDQPPAGGRREFEHDICTMPLEYAPRARSLYSDLGFILLAFIATDRGKAPFAAQFADITGPIAPGLTFGLSPDSRRRAAPTTALDEDVRRGRVLAGLVHDSYAAALGGAAGHAGLFGTAPDVGAYARIVLRAARRDPRVPAPFTPELVRRFTQRSRVPGSSRALAWDTMLPSSSCGTRMSASAFGHVGFTGTSLWIDPEFNRYYVLLTNRAYNGGTPDQMRDVRRAFHDAVGV